LSAYTNIPQINGIKVAAKAFNEADCKKYLDRNLLDKGYQPVQIIIKNNSNKTLIFSPDQVSLPCAQIDQITAMVHTSTAGRVVGYSAAALLASGLFVIPAIVDGVKSSNANKALDADYHKKAAKRQAISPNSKMNALIFVPSGKYTNSFKIALNEEDSNNVHKLSVKVY
jgi:hypothetical protein